MTTTSSTTSAPSAVITSAAPTTSTASTAASATTTNSIDVASIVAQLMTIENKPLDALTSKISSTQTIISDLGTLKSKVASLQSALSTFEDPSTYNNPTASSANSSVVTATATSNAAIGSVNVIVNQLATASNVVLQSTDLAPSFTSASALTMVSAGNPMTLQQGTGTVFSTDTNPPISGTGVGGAVTLTDLKNWVNSLGLNLSANIVQTTSANNWVLQISSTKTGTANAISLGGTGIGNAATNTQVTSALDAHATIGGLPVIRSSNAISDVVNGITFNLTGISATPASATSISVAQGQDNSNAMINTLITAYNAVITQYNSMTANSNNSSTPGNFANDPGMVSFVNDIKTMFANGGTEASSAKITGFANNTAAMNLDLVNGYLQVGLAKYNFSTINPVTPGHPTVSDFTSWVNGLGSGVNASFDGSNILLNSSANSAIDLHGVSTNPITRTTISLASMGMDIQLDGSIQFNTANYQTAVTNNLFGKLSQGLKLGYTNASANIDTYLISELNATNGALTTQIANEQTSVTEMQKQQTDLQARLAGIQQSYVTQYSALNSLLFQLNSTSTSLASSLAAITNINAGH